MRKKFNEKYVRFCIMKCDPLIIKCGSYHKMRHLLQNVSVQIFLYKFFWTNWLRKKIILNCIPHSNIFSSGNLSCSLVCSILKAFEKINDPFTNIPIKNNTAIRRQYDVKTTDIVFDTKCSWNKRSCCIVNFFNFTSLFFPSCKSINLRNQF